ncbi:hypothetical protein CASFOL_039830 [Castilleja foliolosa]|uniref:Homeobox domain-containing protein n=1 Tax=Castilleja foliolosa TaxID=1961234 RepID=A0ABD3BGB2_9LAMI
MSQDYIFNFSNGFDRSHQDQQHIAQQIRRDKLRVQGFDPLVVGIQDESTSSVNYETESAGMLSEMFNFPPGNNPGPTATELLESQILQSYRPNNNPRPTAVDWFLHHRQGMSAAAIDDLGVSKNQTISSINSDSAAAMQLFLMNPQQQQRSPSPSPSNPAPPQSTLHMLMPNPAGGGFGQFTWVNNENNNNNNPNENIPGVVEGQGLSLSLSSSLEAAKAESNMLFFGSTPAANQYQFKNLGGGGVGGGYNNQHMGVGGPSSSTSAYGAVSMLRSSKYAKAAQELLEEFCSVGRGPFKKNTKTRRMNNDSGNPNNSGGGGGGGVNSSSSSKDVMNNNPPLSAADRVEHQRRKVKLLSMLDEVDRRYNHYCEQMQMVVNSFDMVMGFGAATPYTSLAQKAMSRHFRCLKDAISAQLRHSCEQLGEKDAGASGVTKGETPRLRMLEQSLRQQRAFHQMGMMEQEAWRPQRGLPERSVNILRAWLFEHFLHPYPSDADKQLLSRQTGLSRNQVSNWFINARVRLWKPMVEEMYQQEAKDDDVADQHDDHDHGDKYDHIAAQNPTPYIVAPAAVPASATSAAINVHHENDASFMADSNFANPAAGATAEHSFPAMHEPGNNSDDIEGTLIRFGTSTAGDVSLTLGLRHAGNLPEKGHFSVRDFGGC